MMPPNPDAAVQKAAQRHAYAQLVRTEGWRLYMAHLLTMLAAIDRGEGDAVLTDYERAKVQGRKEHILREIAYVYREADEENPLEAERKATLARLTSMLYKTMPEPQAPPPAPPQAPEAPPGRSRRYAGGVA